MLLYAPLRYSFILSIAATSTGPETHCHLPVQHKAKICRSTSNIPFGQTQIPFQLHERRLINDNRVTLSRWCYIEIFNHFLVHFVKHLWGNFFGKIMVMFELLKILWNLSK